MKQKQAEALISKIKAKFGKYTECDIFLATKVSPGLDAGLGVW